MGSEECRQKFGAETSEWNTEKEKMNIVTMGRKLKWAETVFIGRLWCKKC
jgi:hypothetical protein